MTPSKVNDERLKASGFVKVRLEKDGAFVSNVWVPPFLTPPEVITWGIRTFERHGPGGVYSEVFAYHVADSCTAYD